MPRTSSVFYNLVTDENSTTELLCNLLRFPDFRVGFLELFLPREAATRITWEDCDTQISLSEYGIPDLQIKTEDLFALFEIKVRPGLSPTYNQTHRYFEFLSRQVVPERYLTYLVPHAWAHRDQLAHLLDRTDVDLPQPAIHTKIICWNEVVALLERLVAVDRNSFLLEFNELLTARIAPKPVVFSHEEVSMLFSHDFAEVLCKLQRLVDEVQGQGTMYNVRPEGTRSLSPTNYGMYFRDSKNRSRLWFGVWGDFWLEHKRPVCFGVDRGWGEPVVRAFQSSNIGPTMHFKKYELGWVEERTLTSANAARLVWEQISPVVEATIAAELP